jgi:hypothetical protein
VCDQETSKNEEAKARYRAVKIQPQWVVTPEKQTNNILKQRAAKNKIQQISSNHISSGFLPASNRGDVGSIPRR